MNLNDKNVLAFVYEISENNLYVEVIQQLQKDFELSGLAIELDEFMVPEDLIIVVYQQIHHLLVNNFDGYLQLLYRIDVAEQKIITQGNTTEIIAQKSTYNVLQREYQKVKLREKYS